MNLIIVSWNILGQYNIAQLIDRMIENGWDLLIVLEPQQASTREASHRDVTVLKVYVGDQYIYVLHRPNVSTCTLTKQTIMSGERSAVLIQITASRGASYRLLTAHAPYRKNDGTAAQYQRAAMNWAGKNNIDLIIGDFNTYGSKVGSSARSNFRNLSEGLATSRGGNQLDKALLHEGYYGLPSDVNASTMELDDIELPDESYVRSGSRASARLSVQQSRQGRGKKSDHRPMIVMLPSAKLLSTSMSSPAFGSNSLGSVSSATSGPTAIDNDGHCLYRCIAHIMWRDQGRYQEVRAALADFMRRNWAAHPFLQHLHSVGQLEHYADVVRTTNAWGGEFELHALTQIYNLTITMVSPQGYNQANYGTGHTHARIRHTGTHFEIL